MRSRITLLLVVCSLFCLGMACKHAVWPHTVTLTWQEPLPTPGISVVGYNVYRSTSASGPFVKIASRVAKSPYEDRLVGDGRTYFYTVTSIDQNGRESMFSAQTSVTIP